MADTWQEWSQWIIEGWNLSYIKNNITYYEHVRERDLAHYVLEWHETINPAAESGPKVPEDLVMTLGYDSDTTLNRIWQVIFGIKGQVYIYVELPTDTHRHGIPKIPKPRTDMRKVSHFEEYMSDFHEPSFLTEHIMMRPGFDRINLSAYNPQDIKIKPYLNIFINKMTTERVGREQYGKLYTPVVQDNPDVTALLKEKWSETLQKMYKCQIPVKGLTLKPVWAPEAD